MGINFITRLSVDPLLLHVTVWYPCVSVCQNCTPHFMLPRSVQGISKMSYSEVSVRHLTLTVIFDLAFQHPFYLSSSFLRIVFKTAIHPSGRACKVLAYCATGSEGCGASLRSASQSVHRFSPPHHHGLWLRRFLFNQRSLRSSFKE